MTEIIDNKESESKPWITITVAGATAGLVVASLTYASANTASNVVASASGFTVDCVGEVAGAGTTYLLGPATGLAVKLATKAFSKTAEESVRYSGVVTAGVLSAVAGTATALTITAGTRLIEYSIEYGGKLSKEMAIQISEAYLKYKAKNSQFKDTGDLDDLIDEDVDGWLFVSQMNEPIIKE